MNSPDLHLIRTTALATGRYQSWRPEFGVPIRSTVGYPRFWRSATNGPLTFAKVLAPYALLDLSDDEAASRYRDRLDRDADTVVSTLAAIASEHPGKPLCILCYEDVHAGEQCHRRWLADWLQERHGITVPEVGTPGHPSGAGRVPEEPLRLFD